MFGGDLAGIGRATSGGKLNVDVGIALAKCLVQRFAQFRAGRDAGDDFAFLLGRLDGLVPIGLPRQPGFGGMERATVIDSDRIIVTMIDRTWRMACSLSRARSRFQDSRVQSVLLEDFVGELVGLSPIVIDGVFAVVFPPDAFFDAEKVLR